MIKISEINIYPIKSLGGISLETAQIERRGLKFDRRRMLVDAKNKFITQREFPKMAALSVEIFGENLRVSENAENQIDISAQPKIDDKARVKIWSANCSAKVYEDQVNEWFSDVLQTNCKLVLMPEETIRRVNYFYAVEKDDHVSFADAYPFLLIGKNSLTDLNERLKNPVPMNRFRPNFVVENSEPFAEDGWKKIKIGAAIFHLVKPCARCVITTIDQKTGENCGVEPLKTLATYRIPPRSIKKKILFGQNLIAENAGNFINVGDPVEILESQNPPKT